MNFLPDWARDWAVLRVTLATTVVVLALCAAIDRHATWHAASAQPENDLSHVVSSESAVVLAGCSDPSLSMRFPRTPELAETMAAYNASAEVSPPLFRCEPLEFYADSGAGVRACGTRLLRTPCTIYSIGARLDFTFEALMSLATPCDIVVADCLVDASAAHDRLPPRTTFFPVCLGRSDAARLDGGRQVTLPTLMGLAGHSTVDLLLFRRGALLPGADGVASLLALPRDSVLPFQVAMDARGDRLLHRDMAAMGYVAVSRAGDQLQERWTWVRAYCSLAGARRAFPDGRILPAGPSRAWMSPSLAPLLSPLPNASSTRSPSDLLSASYTTLPVASRLAASKGVMHNESDNQARGVGA